MGLLLNSKGLLLSSDDNIYSCYSEIYIFSKQFHGLIEKYLTIFFVSYLLSGIFCLPEIYLA